MYSGIPASKKLDPADWKTLFSKFWTGRRSNVKYIGGRKTAGCLTRTEMNEYVKRLDWNTAVMHLVCLSGIEYRCN